MACPTVSAPVMTQKEIFSISELGVELLVLLPEVDELEAVPDHGLCRVLGHVLMFFEVAEAVFVGWFSFEYIIRFVAAPQKYQ